MGDEAKRSDERQRLERIFLADRGTLPADGGESFNRLIFASSPYLLQHADNPVDWHQWGEEAFARARSEDKPVFLSIGYATCHWCHVMAHESFEDPEVAAVLNRSFVAVKVDREERPDIDDTYMRVAQMMGGRGGWPLTIVMTPDREPFFSATYIPKNPRGGMPGLMEVLGRIDEVWRTRRELVRQNCEAIMAGVARLATPQGGDVADDAPLHEARRQLGGMYDPLNGGFGGAPKFPMPLQLQFLLRYARRFGDAEALAMAEATLHAMRRGGIYDQLGFGFHRYSVDERWLVPHFEKMLYDQALCAIASVEAFQSTGRDLFRETAAEVCTFVLRELTSPEGGFYSALDADSEGEEGRYYLWTPAEIGAVLGEPDAAECCRLFGVTETGNFEGRTILHLPSGADETPAGGRSGRTERVERWRQLLLAARERRVRPFRDEKVVTAWNGLMMAALVKTYLVCGDGRFLEAAEGSARFIERHLTRDDGRLLRSIHRGDAGSPAFLEDYAFLAGGVLELYGATLEPRHLAGALRLAREMLRLFGGDGGLFDVGSDAETVLVRGRDSFDGALPSANSVAASVLLRLGAIADDEALREKGVEIVRSLMGGAGRQPVGHLQLLMAFDLIQGPGGEAVLEGDDVPELRAMLRELGQRFFPGLAVRGAQSQAAPGGAEARLCAGGACHPPRRSAEELGLLLDQLLEELYPASR
ncbi:thioredoxin domain-containing protein [Geobacter pickeringii]|uniref:Thioredoxin n=1 Tax=Geobacter pickeringii TaxID=345632 RepID=A0A0B5BCZ3_9BACT|nr:thioredoxin domain-containing protein [Geobacter pickeringii]AJE02959.1 thioredoxin [Geobacter pickeringii]